MFSYRTRANSSPQSKQKVFFTCEPADFDAFFEKISVSILKCVDCAIWYKDDDDYEDIETDLGGMNAFIIPVTTKLLTTRNRTISVDLPFALNHHIPVLPLLMEKDLDDVYQKVFGDLHYLDLHGNEKTEQGFHDKCRSYIQTILLNTSIIDRVKQAFDAYVFISYRKKDRKHAHDLMRLIHDNSFCRAIAVWYDEYLIPGENFNEAIEKALHNCELFSLVVTPNLYIEQNYVQSVEYPLAKKEGKPILSVEMQATDKEKLSKCYTGIGYPVAQDNITKVLLELLGDIAKQENENDQEHNYYIGLAYLKGIDVERNSERGLELIITAAQSGVYEAIRTLVDVYESGDGVKKNPSQAIKWQRVFVEKCLNRLSNPTIMNCEEYLNSLMHLGDLYMSIEKPQNAEPIYCAFYECSVKFKTVDISLSKYELLSIEKLGDVYLALGDIGRARSEYTKTLKIREQRVQDTGTREAKRDLARSYDRLAEVKMRKSYRMDTLLGSVNNESVLGPLEYIRALEIRESLVSEDENVDDMFELSHSLKMVAKGLIHLFTQTAEKYCLRALEIDEKLSKDLDTPETKENLSECYMLLGDVYKENRDRDRAEEYYKKALTIKEKLAFETGQLQFRRSLSSLVERIGDFYWGQRKDHPDKGQKAVDCYVRAVRIRKGILDDTDTIESILDFSDISSKMIHFYQGKEAEKYATSLLEMNERIADNKEIRGARINVLEFLNTLAEVKKEQGDIDAAERYYLKRLECSEQFMSEEDLPDYRTALCRSLNELYRIRMEKNDISGAKNYKLRVINESWPFVTPDSTGWAGIYQARDYYECATMTEPYDIQLLKEAYDYCDESYRLFSLEEYREIRDKIEEAIEMNDTEG